METTIYDVDYFIKKFEAIDDKGWGVGFYSMNGLKCAYGHCGIQESLMIEGNIETNSLAHLFLKSKDSVMIINDGKSDRYQQPTPKQRILQALYDIKAKQQPAEPKEKIIYKTVIIDSAVKELQETLTEN